ncbi:e3 SUMO-protein ligase PIAS1-like protein [Aphelenchoides avenae]|nr:e3 SUMO-protein ligase PIAS1-like protein [Aphelenchus avenae]
MSDEASRRWKEQRTRKRRGETSDAAAAFKKVRYSAESRLPTAETRRMIIAHFHENDDLSVPTYRVSLFCPLSKRRMAVAARGMDCTHIQCFDLQQFLEFQVQTSLWACPIAGCSKQLRLAQLRVDQYFCEAIDALRNRREVADLDLLPSGGYAAVEPRTVPECQDVPDDGSPYVPAPVEPKHEPLDASTTSDGDANAANASGPAVPIVVDLTLVDDEEPLQSWTTVHHGPRKSKKRHGPSQVETDKLLDALARKDAELNRREEELQSAYQEIQRLREELAGKKRQEGMFRQNLSEANADGTRLRRTTSLGRRPGQTVNREIKKIETIKTEVRRLEETVGKVSADWPQCAHEDAKIWNELKNPFGIEHPLHKAFQSKLAEHSSNEYGYRFHNNCVRDQLQKGDYKDIKHAKERILNHQYIAEYRLAVARSLRRDLVQLYRSQLLPATKLEELALLHERLQMSEKQELQLHEKLQEAKESAPSGN